MESFAKEAPDVYWPKKMRRLFPFIKDVIVEAKKRKAMNIQKFFVEAKLKYGKGGRYIILATRRPATSAGRESFRKLKKRVGKRFGLNTKKERKQVKLSTFIAPLMTVDLFFFQELWIAWLEAKRREHEKGKEKKNGKGKTESKV